MALGLLGNSFLQALGVWPRTRVPLCPPRAGPRRGGGGAGGARPTRVPLCPPRAPPILSGTPSALPGTPLSSQEPPHPPKDPSALLGTPCPPRDTPILPKITVPSWGQPLSSEVPLCLSRDTSVLPETRPSPPETSPSSQRPTPALSAGGGEAGPQEQRPGHRSKTLDGGRTDAPQPSPRGRPRLGPQTHLGHVIVLLHNGLGVELLGGDQAQPQGQQEESHGLWWGPHLRPKGRHRCHPPPPLMDVPEPMTGAPWSPPGRSVQPGQRPQREVGSGRVGIRHPGPEPPRAAEAPMMLGPRWPLHAPGGWAADGPAVPVPAWPTCLGLRASLCPCS